MDIRQTSRYFDRQDFDCYDSDTGQWAKKLFKGQVKVSDKFISMWNRATRKRMLYTDAKNEEAVAPVIRLTTLPTDIYMVGTFQRDVHANMHYRSVANIQHVQGVAVIKRRAPAGPSNDPGWAVDSTVMTTYGDYELRSLVEGQELQALDYGSYFLFLPSNVVLHREDVVELDGKVFFVYETYKDSGLISARATVQPDERIDVVFHHRTGQIYDPNTQTNVETFADFNVTARVKPVDYTEGSNADIVKRSIQIVVRKDWFPGAPDVRDTVTFESKIFRIVKIEEDFQRDEWVITANI